jgi:hypothetical protein
MGRRPELIRIQKSLFAEKVNEALVLIRRRLTTFNTTGFGLTPINNVSSSRPSLFLEAGLVGYECSSLCTSPVATRAILAAAMTMTTTTWWSTWTVTVSTTTRLTNRRPLYWRFNSKMLRIRQATTISSQPPTYLTRSTSAANMGPIWAGSRQYRLCRNAGSLGDKGI